MNSTAVESPGSHEHFFIFGSPPLDSVAPSYNFCLDARKGGSCFEQHRNVSRLVETGTQFHQNAASTTMTFGNKRFATAVDEDRCDEMSTLASGRSSNSLASHLSKEVFSRRDSGKLKADDALPCDNFARMSLRVERDDCEKETLDLIHSTLRSAGRFNVTCLFCERTSPVFDDFPVVDGTLFTSPVQLSCRAVVMRQKQQQAKEPQATKAHAKYMEFVCVGCLTGKSNLIRCVACDRPWSGDCFQLGTLYSYNILSAMPCCARHVACKRCRKPIVEPSSDAYFSFYSNKITCPHCQDEDFHFVKSPVLFGK